MKSGYNDDSTSVQVAYGANYALPENPFTRSGYDFTGWKNLAGETVFGVDGKSNVLIAEGVAKG